MPLNELSQNEHTPKTGTQVKRRSSTSTPGKPPVGLSLMLSLSRCPLPEYTATHFFVFLSVDIWVVSSLGLIRAALALTLYFFFNMMYVLAFTYMCLGEHMCAALVGMSAHRSRRAGSECGNMFDIRRHHQRVSKTVVGTYAPTSHGGTFRLLHALVNIRNHPPFSIQPFRWDV